MARDLGATATSAAAFKPGTPGGVPREVQASFVLWLTAVAAGVVETSIRVIDALLMSLVSGSGGEADVTGIIVRLLVYTVATYIVAQMWFGNSWARLTLAVVLRAFAVELQRLLLGERAEVINRAAISEATSDPTFAQVLAARGRGSVVPKLERYHEGQRERGRLDFEDAGTAVDALIGLTIGDQQVRRLLGVLSMPEPERIEARAERAVRGFLELFGRGRSAK